jgi:hypothetical protein
VETARKPSHGWDRYPNLRLGIGGAKGKGRLQRLVARAFVGDSLLSSSEVYDWCYARHRALGQRIPQRHRHSVYRLLVVMCEPIGRASTIGKPILWRLRTRHARDTTNN